MPEIMLQSKIGVPLLRKQTVARRRLLEYADHDFVEGNRFTRKLTLVSAPAGYGKTSMVAEWLQMVDLPIAWLSLDDGDNDPNRFISYLVAAIQSIQPGFGEEIMSLIQSPQRPPAEMLITQILNQLQARPMAFVLVLDDYHTISNLKIHQQISFLLDHLPPHMHLVLITRQDPLIPIARLRAGNQTVEIRQDDLRFDFEETVDFLNRVMQLKLAAEDGRFSMRQASWQMPAHRKRRQLQSRTWER